MRVRWCGWSRRADEIVVSIVPTNLASSMAGTQQAEKVEAADKRKREVDKARAKAKPHNVSPEQTDEVIVQVEAAEAVRHLAGNEQEEAHNDRQSKPRYDARGKSRPDEAPRIDMEG